MSLKEHLIDTAHLDMCSLPHPYCDVNFMPFNPDGWYGHDEPLEEIIRINKVKTIIEVGSWMGLSTRHLARVIPEEGIVYAVDTWLGTPTENRPAKILATLYDQFLSNVIHTGLTHKIVPIRMESIEAANTLQVRPDLIYLDATHEYECVLKDLEAWYPFVQEQGILCGDDWEWGVHKPVKRAVADFAHKHQLTIELYGGMWRLKK